MLGPFPNEKAVSDEGNFKISWNRWLNNLQNLVDFGEPPSSDTNISAPGPLGVTAKKMRIQSATAGNVTITSNPRITKGYDGQELTLEGLDATKTVTLPDGNGISLTGGTTVVLGLHDTINFHYNQSKDLWIEQYRSIK